MDLKETVAAANEEGLSYGEYVAKHDQSEDQPVRVPDPLERTCAHCGKTFRVKSTKNKIKKYCNEVCAYEARQAKMKQQKLEKPKDKPAGDQTAKADAGKPRPTLVPPEVIWAIAEVREYGIQKYGDPDNWKRVDPQRYRDAMFRHMLAYLADNCSSDDESKLPHLWHVLTNGAFLCAMEGGISWS